MNSDGIGTMPKAQLVRRLNELAIEFPVRASTAELREILRHHNPGEASGVTMAEPSVSDQPIGADQMLTDHETHDTDQDTVAEESSIQPQSTARERSESPIDDHRGETITAHGESARTDAPIVPIDPDDLANITDADLDRELERLRKQQEILCLRREVAGELATIRTLADRGMGRAAWPQP